MKFHKSHPFSPHEKCFFYKVKRSERFTQQHYATFLLGCMLLMLLPEISRSQAVLNSDWPIRVLSGVRTLTHCEGLGFPNSTKNECGFCVGGATGLAENFGKDCSGTCGGKKVIDCSGVCDGSAYVDECSGLCIGGTTNIKEGDAPNPHRDCRGYCLTSGGQYFLDTCGVCNGGRSPFEDCTNKCHLPGQEDRMAKLVCSRCVGGSSQVSESQVLDACGNCKSEEQKCVCNGVGEPDPCDKCNDGGRSCMRALSFAPQAAPNQTEFDLLIKGAFRGRRQYLRCLLTPVSNNEIGVQLEFVGTSNGTHLECRVKLISGTYKVGASLMVGEKPEISRIEDAELLIYDDANYVSMAPLRTIFDRDSSKELILTFTGGKVPPRPLTCIISGTGWPPGLRIAPGDPNSHHTCILPYANTSVRINVAPSLNGIHPFTNTFSFTFYSSPPEMKKYYIAEDGHAVIIVFDRPVKICNLKTCSDMLNNETLERLGGNATCQWATKQQLVITVQRPITGNPMRITFKKEVLMQDDQEYPLSKNEGLTIDAWYPQPSSRAQLAISGASTLPLCGNFTLVGHFSSPKGDAQFFWTAYRGDRQRLEHIIAQALLGVRKATLTLDIALLEVGMNYTFVLTAQHPVNDKYEARHIVERKPYSGALITAYSDVMNQPSVSASQSITLQAEVSLPECYTEGESVQLLWSVNNALVKFDFGSRDSYLYKILPYSLPDNTEITFYAMAYFINLENVTSSTVKLNVEPHILKAAIKGSSKRSVGNRDGFLVLESTDDNGGLPLVYQWRCYDKNDICYNYGRDATSALLIDREKQKSPVLTIPLENLKAGQVLTFELQVFNAKNRYHSSSAASTIVVVENGSIPQVVVQSVSSDGIGVFERNPTTTAYSIPARLPIMIHATINVTSGMQLKSVQWDIKGVSASFGYSTLNTDTYLMLEEGFLIDHGIFLIGLSACTVENACGIANLTIHAVPGTTLCQLDTPSFIEYEWVQASVVGCSIPTGRQPLTYQLFVSINGTLITLTPPQTSTVFEFYGPPVSQGNISQFYLQVCDKYNLCKLFPGDLVKSFENEVKMVDRMKLFDKAKRYSKTTLFKRKIIHGALSITLCQRHILSIRENLDANLSQIDNNPVPALALYLTAAMDTKTPLKLDETKAMVDSARSAVVNRYVNSGQLSLVYSAMLPLLRQDDKQVKGLALAVMRTATNQAYSYDVRPPTFVLALGHGNAMEAIRNTADDSVMQKVRATQHTIVKFISRTLQLGSRRVLPGGDQGQPSTVVFRQLLSRDRLSITAQDADGKTVEGTVAFEPDVRNRFMQWRSSESQQICNGVVVSLTLYPGASPYPKAETLVSPIFDVSMRDPSTGNIMSQSFGDESDSVRLSITNLGNLTQAQAQGKVFKCMYWDDSAKEWTMYGVKTMGLEGDAMTCWASHLSTFAVFEMTQELSREKERLASLYNKRGLSTSSIVGIVVAVLVGVFIIGMFLFFFMRKKQAKSVRVSTETLQPKHIEKMKGMERTIAHVKKFAMN